MGERGITIIEGLFAIKPFFVLAIKPKKLLRLYLNFLLLAHHINL
jgi:hypothetical protein